MFIWCSLYILWPNFLDLRAVSQGWVNNAVLIWREGLGSRSRGTAESYPPSSFQWITLSQFGVYNLIFFEVPAMFRQRKARCHTTTAIEARKPHLFHRGLSFFVINHIYVMLQIPPVPIMVVSGEYAKVVQRPHSFELCLRNHSEPHWRVRTYTCAMYIRGLIIDIGLCLKGYLCTYYTQLIIHWLSLTFSAERPRSASRMSVHLAE